MLLPGRMLLYCLLLSASPTLAASQAEDYRLGPEDQLQIRIFDLRTGSGEVYKWSAFDGEYLYHVGAGGSVSVPLLGEVQAAGKTTGELAKALGEKLQARVGLASEPNATVQVAKHRPFYVDGVVQKPGDYEYRPGMTVLQAVSMAGGVSRATGEALLGVTREALSSRGDLRVLNADRLAFEARQVRLDAEIGGADAIAWPPGLQGQQGDADVARILREERLLFESRRNSLRAQLDVLDKSRELLRSQVQTLAAKSQSLDHQFDLSKRELDQVTSLVSRGLAAMPRQLALEQSTAQFQSNRLDLQVATLQTQQDLSKADQDSLTLVATRRNEALQEATEVHNKLAQTREKIDTTRALLFQSEVRAPAVLAVDGATAQPRYALTRRTDGRTAMFPVQAGDAVQPGDVITVDLQSTNAADAPAAARDSADGATALTKLD